MNRRIWILVPVALLIGTGIYLFTRRTEGGQEGTARWRTATATRGDLVASVSGSGTAGPVAQVEVKSRATGVVLAVLVDEGQRVTKGQTLARIEDPDALAAVRNAEANLASATAQLRRVEAQRRALAAQDAGAVRQAEANLAAAQARLAQVQAGTRQEEIAQAQQAVRVAEAELDLARRAYERNRQLFQDGFISQQEVEQAEAAFRTAEARHRSAVEHLNQLRRGATMNEVAEARAQVRQAEAALQQARARALDDPVRAQEIAAARAQVSLARSNLTNARERVAETLIRAPVAGVVAVRSVEVGQSVIGGDSGTPVLTLAVDRPIVARVMVDQVDITQVRPGLVAEIRADGLGEEVFSGTTLAVSPQAQTVNNVVQYEVTVRVDDPRHRLRLGMTVDAEFIISRRRDVVLVPAEAVRGTEERAVLVVEGERLVPRIVQTGTTDGRQVEITAGLREGEIVYLGEARRPQQGSSPPPRNPFAPNLPARPGRNR